MKKETRGTLSIFAGILVLFGSLGAFLSSGNLLDLFISSLGVYAVLASIFIKRRYYNKTYYLGILGMIIVQGMILGYTYIFAPVVYTADKLLFYLFTGGLILYTFIFVYSYPKRRENPDMPWKEGW